MVAVVQWLEHWIVVPVVGGSSPLSHPIYKASCKNVRGFFVFENLRFKCPS